MLDDIQAHYSTLYQLGSNTGASFQAMRDLLSAAFPPTQLYYFLRLSVFVNEPFRSKAQKLLAQVMRKRQLQSPSTLTQLLLPPLHVRNWKAQLGTWLQRWVASHRDLFPSLFLPKIRVVETRSATLGERIYNYRTWQRRWTPDVSFPCRCLDIDDHHLHRAHEHAVMVDEFSRINADIDMDIMAASMKDQYFGDVDLLHQRFTTQLRKLARRWHVHGSSLLTNLRPVLTQLIDTHRSNLQDRAYWSSTSLQRTVASLSSWVVIPADHFPSRAHVICPSLFAILMHKTFCSGEVFSLCRQSAASFRSEVVTTIPSLLHQRYAWGLRLQAPLPTARILPKPTKDWQKARPIISFFRTWAAPFLTVFGALIFELTKVTFPDIPGQLSVQELVQQLWDALPAEYIHLVSQDLSGFFTSIPTERFHQALQVLLHRYDQVVGLRRSSQWSVYELKSDHRRRMFKGKWRRQTKVPRTFREQDLHYLLDFVIDNSHFEINGYLFRQERGVAVGSPAAPPLCNLVATVEDFFWHQTVCSLRFRMPDVGVIWHERYVDNRFILLRDSAPRSPVLRNFQSLEFYRPPVMLEFQHDDKVLGYLCDSSSRTITPQLPDHPSQIKGIRSANDQMFTYSSWSSRSWLILRGAQPAVQQQHGLNALKRLYEAKGFDPHLLRDVRRRLGTKSACCLVAVLLVVCACDCLSECRVMSACSWLKTMAEYMVTSLLRPDGSVQTTSQVTLDHLPNFINGNEMQLFVRTHGLVHQHNVQAHSSSRDVPALGSATNIRAVRNHPIGRRSRSPRSRRSRVRLTPGPQGMSEDEEDWGEWKGDGPRAHDGQRRPRSPALPPTQFRAPVNQIELLHLPVRQHVPDLGSHRFTLRAGCRIKEIAILVDGVLPP